MKQTSCVVALFEELEFSQLFRNSPNFFITKITLPYLLQFASVSVPSWTRAVLCFWLCYNFNFHSDITNVILSTLI